MTAWVWTTPDDVFLRLLAGTVVNHPVELPSGMVMSADEAQAWADFYDPIEEVG